LFGLLVGACAVGAAAAFPYSLALLPEGRMQVRAATIVAAAVVQTSVLAAIATACDDGMAVASLLETVRYAVDRIRAR
jgi:hypothetical protein